MICKRIRNTFLTALLVYNSTVLAQQTAAPALLDAEQAFQVAKQASAAGDYQAAIIALERVLVISPGLANIQFELGLLYKLVGAPQRAEYFFRESLKDDEMPQEYRQRAEDELVALESTRRLGDFNFNVGIGLQHESNPAATSERKQAFNLATMDYETNGSLESEKSYGSSNYNLGGNYRSRFGNAARHEWNVGAAVSGAKYFGTSEFDDTAIGLNAGATFEVASNSPGIRNRITPVVSYTFEYDKDGFEDSIAGIGLQFLKYSSLWSASLSTQLSAKRYDDNIEADYLDEDNSQYSIDYRFRVSEKSRTTFGVNVSRATIDAALNSRSYRGSAARVSVTQSIPSWQNAPSASVSVFLGYGRRAYDAIDFAVSNSEPRRDTRPQFGWSINVPFSSGLEVNAGIRMLNNRSNLPNYRYDNWTTSFGVNWRF